MRLLLLAIILLSVSAFAQQEKRTWRMAQPFANDQSLPGTPRMQSGAKNVKLKTFLDGWGVAGTDGAYELTCDVVSSNCGIAILRSTGATADSYGTLLHRESAVPWRGQHVRLRTELRGGRVDAWAGAWLRAEDKDGKLLAARTMRSAPVSGTTSFQWAVLDFEVPAEAVTLLMGIELQGTGAVFVREIELEAASEAVSSR